MSEEKHRLDYCAWATGELKKLRRVDEGVFDAQKSNIGRTEPSLALLFLTLNSEWRKFNATYLDGNDARCRYERTEYVSVVSREVDAIKRTFDSIRKEIRSRLS